MEYDSTSTIDLLPFTSRLANSESEYNMTNDQILKRLYQIIPEATKEQIYSLSMFCIEIEYQAKTEVLTSLNNQ
jgi:hypothetical protein